MNSFRLNRNFNRFILLVVTMIQCVHNRFFQSLNWIIEETEAFGNILLLYDIFANERVFQIGQRSLHLLRDTPVNSCLTKIVRSVDTAFWENDYICLCILKELFRMFAKHHCGHILQHPILDRASHQIHLL